MNGILKQLKHPLMYASFALVAVIAVGSFAYYEVSSQRIPYRYVEAKRGTVLQVVDATGNVVAAENINLAFEKSGKVVRVSGDVGQSVVPGTVLVVLDSQDLAAQLAQAVAAAKTQEAKLNDLKNGARPEDVQVTQAQLDLNRQDLASAYATAPDILNDAYNKADDAVRKQLDAMFVSDETNPQPTFQISDSQTLVDITTGRQQMTVLLNAWKSDLSKLDVSSGDSMDRLLAESKTNLGSVQSFLNRIADALVTQLTLQQAQLDAYRINISTARAEVTAGLAGIDTLQQKLSSQKLVIEQTQRQLELKQAGSTADAIAAQEAQVEAAQAAAASIRAQISKTYITSPLNGIVARNDAKVGEIVSPGVPLVTLISKSAFHIETYIPGVDMAKVRLNDNADVTLDAYGGDVHFVATVISIEPVETVMNGVSTYKTKLEFTGEDNRITSGLTANVHIETARRENVVTVPAQAIIRRNSDRFVLMKSGTAEPTEQKVVTGIEGSDGVVEVVSGLTADDQVVDFGNGSQN